MGSSITNEVRVRVRKRHQNYEGQRFKAYAKNYAEIKSANKAAQTQASTSTTPDMTLTGKTMDDLQVFTVTDKSVVFGWVGTFAGVVASLFSTKNYQIVNLGAGNPLHPKDDEKAFKLLNKFIDKQIKKYESEDIILGGR